MMPEGNLSFYETLSLLIALLAVVVAFVSLYRTNRVAARQLKLQEAQAAFIKFQHGVLAKEQATKHKADIRISIAERPLGKRLVISNVGDAPARDIIFEAVIPDGTRPFLIQSEMDALLPITQLLPNQEVSMFIAPTLGSARLFLAKISWFNETGDSVRQNLEVTF